MELYLMRHADAEPSAGNDFTRLLTEKGRKQAVKMAEWLRALDLGYLRLMTSPYPRAHETANIVAEILGPDAVVQPDERLASGMTVDAASALIHEAGTADGRLCLVGHSPDLDLLAAYLVGAKDRNIEMKKGAVAAFDTARAGFGGSLLKWLIHPKL